MAPVRRNSLMKNSLSSKVMPMAANTTAKFLVGAEHSGLTGYLRASAACGRPEQENMGSFWPRTRVFRPSIVETPVCMNSAG